MYSVSVTRASGLPSTSPCCGIPATAETSASIGVGVVAAGFLSPPLKTTLSDDRHGRDDRRAPEDQEQRPLGARRDAPARAREAWLCGFGGMVEVCLGSGRLRSRVPGKTRAQLAVERART